MLPESLLSRGVHIHVHSLRVDFRVCAQPRYSSSDQSVQKQQHSSLDIVQRFVYSSLENLLLRPIRSLSVCGLAGVAVDLASVSILAHGAAAPRYISASGGQRPFEIENPSD